MKRVAVLLGVILLARVAGATVTDYPVDTDAHDNEVDSTYAFPYSSLAFQNCWPSGSTTNALVPTRYHDGAADPSGHNLVRSVLVAIPADVGGDTVNSVAFGFYAWTSANPQNQDSLSLNLSVHDWSGGCGSADFTLDTTPLIGTNLGTIALSAIDVIGAIVPGLAVLNTFTLTSTAGLHFDGTVNWLRLTMSCVSGDSGGDCVTAPTGANYTYIIPHEYGSHPMFLRIDHSAAPTSTATATVTQTPTETPTPTIASCDHVSGTPGCQGGFYCSWCGDGVTLGSEQCDDGNTVDGDSCHNNCTLP